MVIGNNRVVEVTEVAIAVWTGGRLANPWPATVWVEPVDAVVEVGGTAEPTKDTTAPIIDATMDNGGVEEVEADVVEGAVAEEADTKNQKSQRKN